MYCDWPMLGRCCFCMPLRRGILTFGYINIFFNAFMVGVYSYNIHNPSFGLASIYNGSRLDIPSEVCVVIYCLGVIFHAVLIYGAHMKIMSYIKAYYYFAITTIVATIMATIMNLAESIADSMRIHMFFELGPLMFASICIQIYLIILIRSLLRKMDVTSSPNVYNNPLQQFVYDGVVETNGVYDSTVVPVDV